ncbi:hypothetical protein M422DRAFT_783375 [Sphaerobolus stellatus SS14]|uniref:Uncharacterized protein n=1 Tax=Sphaerobolus stellatus (strain SS14) TaxID=990650 RepID=A0A0C9TQV8_SPHS4|nr:hypothetical protein M422DRAFT_783375 [Sphaerobolus stellatus SS14]
MTTNILRLQEGSKGRGMAARNDADSGKLLPWTPYVVSSIYRTDIFSAKHWKGRSKGETWLAEVWSLRAAWGLRDERAVEVLMAAAQVVDNLEVLLRSNWLFRKACGLNGQDPMPIENISSQILTKFLVTQLLDRLLWGYTNREPDVQSPVFYTHPNLGRIGVGVTDPTAAKYLSLNDSEIQRLVDKFVDVVEFQMGVQTGKETIEKRMGECAGHVAAFANGLHAQGSSVGHLVSSNMWILVASILFIFNIHNSSYVKRFEEVFRKSERNPAVKLLLEAFVNDGRRGTAGRTVIKLIPAAVALCHTPAYVLNPEIDLVEYKLPFSILTYCKVVKAAFRDPAAQSPRALSVEREMWRMVGLLLPDVWRFAEIGDGADRIGEGRQAIHEVLAKQFQKANQLSRAHGTFVRSEWLMMRPDSGESLDLAVASPKRAVLRRQTGQEDETSMDVESGAQEGTKHLAPGRWLIVEAKAERWAAEGNRRVQEWHQMTMPRTTLKDTSYVLVPHVDVRIELIDVDRLLPKKDEQLVPQYLEVEWGRYRQKDVNIAHGGWNIAPSVSRMCEQECILRLERSIQRQDGQFEKGYITFELTWPDYCECDKEYLDVVMGKAQPAEVAKGLGFVIDAEHSMEGQGHHVELSRGLHTWEDIYSDMYFADLVGRHATLEECSQRERKIATRPCLVLPRYEEDTKELYISPILEIGDIQLNLRIDVNVRHGVQGIYANHGAAAQWRGGYTYPEA